MAREGGTIQWQWQGYDRNHRDVTNLLLHIVLVPLFICSALCTVWLLAHGAWLAAGVSLFTMIFAFIGQGLGHKRETEAPIPFDGAGDFFARIFTEQFITFPRFVLSGGWLRQLQQKD
ncbi:MAG: Mpo1-like protein [Arenimonas sp.]